MKYPNLGCQDFGIQIWDVRILVSKSGMSGFWYANLGCQDFGMQFLDVSVFVMICYEHYLKVGSVSGCFAKYVIIRMFLKVLKVDVLQKNYKH